MARPEDEIATTEASAFFHCMANHGRLQVGVARGVMASSHQGKLHQAGAIQPDRGAPAPEIGREEEALGNGDEIRLRRRVDRRDMGGDTAPSPPASRR